LKNPKQLERFGSVTVEQKCGFECLPITHLVEHMRPAAPVGITAYIECAVSNAHASRDAIGGAPGLARSASTIRNG
jgi:hypothetical protein